MKKKIQILNISLVNNKFLQLLCLSFPFLFAIYSCNNSPRNIESYYFPIESLKAGKIYEYQSVGNEHDPPFYWHYQSVEENGITYLKGTYFDHDFNPFQMITEEQVSNGMLLQEFSWFEPDTTGNQAKVAVNIESGNVFSFEIKEPANVLLSSFSWQPLLDSSMIITFIRNRQYESDTVFSFQNKQYKSLKFYVRELIDQDQEGHLEQEYEASEIYAEGIGLVYFQKDIAADWKMAYKLTNIYDPSAFEKKYGVDLKIRQ